LHLPEDFEEIRYFLACVCMRLLLAAVAAAEREVLDEGGKEGGREGGKEGGME
jgi:hypothetical protein